MDKEAVLEALRAGTSLSEIAKGMGHTRERLRQLAAREGITPSRIRAERLKRRDQEIEAHLRQGWTQTKVAKVLGVSVHVVAKVAAKVGLSTIKGRAAERSASLAPYVDQVRKGRSIMSLERQHAIPSGLLRAECVRQGVRSKARTAHSDLTARYDIVRTERARGNTWAEIAAKVAEAEGHPITEKALNGWAKRKGLA